MGSQGNHTFFEGKGIGILLGLKLIVNERQVTSATIYVDNQAAIQATISIKPGSGNYIFDLIYESITELLKKHNNIKITVRWIPAHKGVEENERADER